MNIGLMRGVGVGILMASASLASASPLLVDRGLPTANLNNAAGASRSNVAWSFTEYTSTNYWLVGDTFQNTNSHTWNIDRITIWTVGRTDTAILRGGIAGGTVGVVTAATYPVAAPGNTYQTPSGTYLDMYRVDFEVSIILNPGETYQFFLDGSGNRLGVVVPFVHASNAALSGSPQDGADDLYLYAHVVNGILLDGSIGAVSSQGYGWDKASDINVQVFGTVPDGGATVGLLGLALVGVETLRRRFRS